MKKNLFIFGLITTVFCFCGCIDPVESRVDVTVSNDNTFVTVAISKDSSADYVNVYRGEVTSTGTDPETGKPIYGEPEEYVSIGQLNHAENDGYISYQFIDNLIVAGKVYKYSVRYVYSNRHVSNTWSGIADLSGVTPVDEATVPYFSNPRLELNKSTTYPADGSTAEDDGTYFTYNPGSYLLTVNNDTSHNENAFKACVSASEENPPAYYLGIAVENSSGDRRIFPVYKNIADQGVGLTAGQQLDMRGVLSEAFWNCDVKVLGFVYFYEQQEDGWKHKIYHWSVPAEVKKIVGCEKEDGAEDNNIIRINYSVADNSGLDFGNRSISSDNKKSQSRDRDSLDFSKFEY